MIFINYRDHAPPPFHARYGDDEVTVEIQGGAVTGRMSKRALKLVLEWSEQNESALLHNWQLAHDHQPLEPIAPLT